MAKRADSIVKNMLLHSREGSGERSTTNVNAMVEEALNLAYHGARAEKPGFNVTIVKSLDPNAGAAAVYGQEMKAGRPVASGTTPSNPSPPKSSSSTNASMTRTWFSSPTKSSRPPEAKRPAADPHPRQSASSRTRTQCVKILTQPTFSHSLRPKRSAPAWVGARVTRESAMG
jgi:hypothetical protein